MTYLVIILQETDGDILILRKTAQEIVDMQNDPKIGTDRSREVKLH